MMSDDRETRPALATPRAANPFSAGEVAAAAPRSNGALVSVEQQRAIAEVQARMIIARTNPRDPMRAVEQILNDCTRPSLAEGAIYQYSRGGTDIRGPSIRLAEAIAQRWGNIASGIREVARHGEHSECIAYAWDLETGFYDERQFQVRHWRDTRTGGYRLTDERDIYELIANYGQRRKRAVLLTVIPGDVTEAATEQCERTMEARADTSGEGVAKLIAAFASLGVTVPQIEARIQRRIEAIRPAQVVLLRKIYNSLRDGMSEAGDWFDAPAAAEDNAPAAQPQPGGPAEPRRAAAGRRRAMAAPPARTEAPAAPARPADDPPDTGQIAPEGGTAPSGPTRRVTFEM